MLRMNAHLVEAVREEWTKYLVNDIECERNAIYQIILDNKFYDGTVNIVKKYHFKLHEERGDVFSRNTSDESKNISANLNLDTKKFAEKFNPAGEKYKSLIEKMIHVVDMFYDAEKNYGNYSQDLRVATRNCFSFMLENLTDSKAPYNDILNDCAIEMYVFLFDIIAFAISKAMEIKNASGNLQVPGLNFDTSSIKEAWDENWTNSKKSQFLNKYFSLMLEQSDVLCKNWEKHYLFADSSSSRDGIKRHFDDFKKCIKSLQDKRAEYDASLLEDQSITSRVASFFNPGSRRTSTDSSTSAPLVNASPKNV